MARIGSGTYGAVYANGYDTVVKVHSEPLVSDRSQEILVLAMMKGAPNIAEFIGVCGVNNIVIRRYQTSLLMLHDRDPDLVRRHLMSILYSVIDALHSMSLMGLCHLDLKPDNILFDGIVDGRPVIKLCDFGLATFLGCPNRGTVCTWWYRPPEAYRCTRSTDLSKIDVWSLGILCIALSDPDIRYMGIVLGSETYAEKNIRNILFWLGRVRRHSMADDVYALASTCLVFDPNHRPSVKDLARLPTVSQHISGWSQDWPDSPRIVLQQDRNEHARWLLECLFMKGYPLALGEIALTLYDRYQQWSRDVAIACLFLANQLINSESLYPEDEKYAINNHRIDLKRLEELVWSIIKSVSGRMVTKSRFNDATRYVEINNVEDREPIWTICSIADGRDPEDLKMHVPWLMECTHWGLSETTISILLRYRHDLARPAEGVLVSRPGCRALGVVV